MKKRYMIWKDIHAFFRDFRSFFLLFLTPILITILVGSLFMSSGAEDIPIIVCTEKPTSIYDSTISLVKGSGVFILIEKQGDCMDFIDHRLRSGKVRAGIIVPEITMGSTIEIYVDNTKPIGTYLTSYFNLISKDVSNRLINAYISDALNNLEANEYQLNELEAVIDEFDFELMRMEDSISDIEGDLSGITLEGMENDANNIKTFTSSLRSNIANTRSLAVIMNYTDIIDDLDSLSGSLDNIDANANAIINANNRNINLINNRKQDVQSKLNTMKTSLEELRDHLNTIKDSTVLIKAVLAEMKEEVPEYSDPVKSKVIGFFGEKSYINFIFPSILIMIVMWMATFLSSINFIRQKNRGILRRISVSPMKTRTIATEKITANAIISLIPLPFILLISFFILGIEMSLFNAIFVFLAASLSVLVFSILGLIIGSFSKSETTAILGSLIVIIPLMFMSGALYPVEAFPDAIKAVTEFLPINTGIRLVEGFLFYTFDWVDFMFLIYTMVGYTLILSIGCWFLMRRSLKA